MIDKANGKTLWYYAITKDITNVKVALKIIDDNDSVPRNHQFVKCNMIFDVKMDKFRQKARLVARVHMTKLPSAVTYASVLSCETVHIALAITALNDLQVKCGNFLHAYITAPVMESIWNTLGTKFGGD